VLNKVKNMIALGAFLTLVVATKSVYADACNELRQILPLGTHVEYGGEGNWKIKTVGIAVVEFDDIAVVLDAQMEATLDAKAKIADFLEEYIRKDENVDKVAEQTVEMSPAGKKPARNEVKKFVKTLVGSSQSILRGVVPLATCHEKGKMVMVAVGVKPETIATAKEAKKDIESNTTTLTGNSSSSGGSTSTQTGSGTAPLTGVDSYSYGADRLISF